MTEKIERRGIFTPHSYEPDILQKISVEDVYEADCNVLSTENTIKEVREWIKSNTESEGQVTTFIVVHNDGSLAGIANRSEIFSKEHADEVLLQELIKERKPYIYENNKLSVAIDVMDKNGIDVLPVTDHSQKKMVLGCISHREIFAAYRLHRSDAEVLKRSISLKRHGIKVILKGKSLWGKG